MLSRPQPILWNPDDAARLEIVKRTYENALAAGDKNVYFISGQELMADVKCEGLVDGVHPNDAGFVSMARVMLPTLKKMLHL